MKLQFGVIPVAYGLPYLIHAVREQRKNGTQVAILSAILCSMALVFESIKLVKSLDFLKLCQVVTFVQFSLQSIRYPSR